ncbi:MAG: RidA family protein [Desulfovibrionaceae bacterium]|nr:RidA family protein [Desulfovibrionaceae bacterium]MBF0512842.1 RidA family protein [Desulfovibrionaceae bacterium]
MADHQLISSGSKWEPLLGYSRAVKAGNVVHVSGTVGVGADGVVPKSAKAQAARALEIILDALAKAGATAADVVRTRIYVTNMDDFDDIAAAHGAVFSAIRPATAIVEVSRLAGPDFVVEIEAEAIIG